MRGRFLARSLRKHPELYKDLEFQREIRRLLLRNGIVFPISGAAANLMAGLASQTANVALTVAAANLYPVSGNPLVLQTPGQLPALPWALAFAYVQEITGITAAATCTVNISQLAGATVTQIGGGVSVNQAAGAGPIDAGIYLGLVSGQAQTLTATAILSAGTGTVTNTAALPSIFGALSFL